MSFLRKWVVHNWGLKLLALLASFFLWATYTSAPLVEAGYLVPLEYWNLSAQLQLAGEVPTQVHVLVRGRSAVLRRLTPGDLAITLDLAGAGPGESLLRIRPGQVDVPFGTELVRVSPAEIRVRLVQRSAQP